MPQPLKNTQDDVTSVGKILDAKTAARALGTPSVKKSQQTTPAEPDRRPVRERDAAKLTGEPVDVSREFHLTQSAAKTLNKVVALFGGESGSGITRSHFLRALLMVLHDAMPYLEEAEEASAFSTKPRPSNAAGFEKERQEFERQLAEVLSTGMRAYGLACRPARQYADQDEE